MSGVTLRPYRGTDEAALLDCWNAALPYDPIDPGTFRRKVLCDPNFAADGLLVAETAAGLAGFCLALTRRVPLEQAPLEPTTGWITAYGVRPDQQRQGVGTALLAAAESWFAAQGRTTIALAPYLPNYFVPGLDEARYATGLAFLQARGWEVTSRPLSMDANLVLLDLTPYHERAARLAEQGVTVRCLRPEETAELLAFLRAQMPDDWVRHARAVLTDAARGLAGYQQFSVAATDQGFVGYCQWEGEHFGPFGVRNDRQGQGIGTVLLAHCLETMRAHGHHNAWVLWTSDRTAEHVYGRFGFRETRRFAVLHKRLG